MQETEHLIAALFPENGPGLLDIKFFPGENPVSVEEFSRDAHSALVQVDSGQSIGLPGFEERLNRVTVDRFLGNN